MFLAVPFVGEAVSEGGFVVGDDFDLVEEGTGGDSGVIQGTPPTNSSSGA